MESETRGRKRKRLTGETVTIVVGAAEDSETHTVHANILENQSPFWKSALKKCWEEGAQANIKLPEDNRDAVGTYLEWIYSNTIEVSPLTNEEISVEEVNGEFGHLARAYVFGEKVQDDAFCNNVMDAILKRIKGTGRVFWYPTTDAVATIYNGTPEGSPARELCVYLHTKFGLACEIRSTEDGEHPDFLRDLSRSLLEVRGYPTSGLDLEGRQKWHKSM